MKVKSINELPLFIQPKVRYESIDDVYVFDSQVSGPAGYRYLGQDHTTGKYYYLWLRIL